MCKPISAVILKNRILFSNNSHNHSDILTENGISDTSITPDFVKAELFPENGDMFSDPATWKYATDQDTFPDWYVAEVDEMRLREAAAAYIKDHIHIGVNNLTLSDGLHWVKDCKNITLKGSASVSELINSTVKAMHDNSTIETMHDNSTIETMHDNSTVKTMHDNSTIETMYGNCTVKTMHDNSTVVVMYDSSTVEKLCGISTVKAMYDNSAVKAMCNDSTVETMCGNCTVETMGDSSTIEIMYDNCTVKEMYICSTVETMHDSSTIETMHDNSTIETMHDNSTVKTMHDNSTIETMYDNCTVKTMHDNSTVETMCGISTAIIPDSWRSKYVNAEKIILRENATIKDCRTKTIYQSGQSGDWKLVISPNSPKDNK